MQKIRLIVQAASDDGMEEKIKRLGSVIYALPMISSYVVEISIDDLEELRGTEGVAAVTDCARITAQMNNVREMTSCERASRNHGGKGITIAVLDTGISPVDDFLLPDNRILYFKDFINGSEEAYDDNAHGTHVAGIAAGSGISLNGVYRGIAPQAGIVAIKVLNKDGSGNSADMLAGIQWMIDNKERFNIRVANLSVGTKNSGGVDPIVMGCEAAWDSGIVMVAAAGNNGPLMSSITSPGVSKKIITVGASDDNSSVSIWGDTLVDFSGRGPTEGCIVKPDIVAPGAKVVSCLSKTPNIKSRRDEDFRIVSDCYIEMSGTSMAAPVVAGAVALLLERRPDLKPNEVKYLLKKSARDLNYPQNHQGWGLIDIEKLLWGGLNDKENGHH